MNRERDDAIVYVFDVKRYAIAVAVWENRN